MKHLSKKSYIKIIRYTLGATLSIWISMLLSLDFPMSSGIITILTIQDTKRETIIIALKRLAIFGLMTLFSVLIFPITGYNVLGFAIILIPYLYCCLAFSMGEAVAPIAVLCTHYISSGSCSLSSIANEFLILAIGAGIGILLNLFMFSQLEEIRAVQKKTDATFRTILSRMSIYMLKTNKSDYTAMCFHQLDSLLDSLKQESFQYMNNHFTGSYDYFYHYVQMRYSQCTMLKKIYRDILTLDHVPSQAMLLSHLFSRISTEFDEINDATGLLDQIDLIFLELKKEPLPLSRQEFENRAILYHILMDLRQFLLLKKQFADSLSEEEKETYWGAAS